MFFFDFLVVSLNFVRYKVRKLELNLFVMDVVGSC